MNPRHNACNALFTPGRAVAGGAEGTRRLNVNGNSTKHQYDRLVSDMKTVIKVDGSCKCPFKADKLP